MFQSANLALRFLLELCALASFSYWGFHTGKSTLLKWGLGLGIPIGIAFIWGMFGSPAAPMRLSEGWRIVLELGINGAAVIAIYSTGHTTFATIFAVFVVVNRILMFVWGQ